MAEYRVKWEIDIEATSPRKAAEEALKIQHDPFSTATVFQVCLSNGLWSSPNPSEETIDLAVAEDNETEEKKGSCIKK